MTLLRRKDRRDEGIVFSVHGPQLYTFFFLIDNLEIGNYLRSPTTKLGILYLREIQNASSHCTVNTA